MKSQKVKYVFSNTGAGCARSTTGWLAGVNAIDGVLLSVGEARGRGARGIADVER